MTNGDQTSSPSAVIGWVRKRPSAEASMRPAQSATPGSPGTDGGAAFLARVSGAPRASSSGAMQASMESLVMCTAKLTGSYRPMPDDVATRMTAQPPSQDATRPGG